MCLNHTKLLRKSHMKSEFQSTNHIQLKCTYHNHTLSWVTDEFKSPKFLDFIYVFLFFFTIFAFLGTKSSIPSKSISSNSSYRWKGMGWLFLNIAHYFFKINWSFRLIVKLSKSTQKIPVEVRVPIHVPRPYEVIKKVRQIEIVCLFSSGNSIFACFFYY